jgi:hypothetical protein
MFHDKSEEGIDKRAAGSPHPPIMLDHCGPPRFPDNRLAVFDTERLR